MQGSIRKLKDVVLSVRSHVAAGYKENSTQRFDSAASPSPAASCFTAASCDNKVQHKVIDLVVLVQVHLCVLLHVQKTINIIN